jgi:hypothetical protein
VLGGGDGWGHLANVQCKAIWNCHNESPMHNEYILTKMEKKNRGGKVREKFCFKRSYSILVIIF